MSGKTPEADERLVSIVDDDVSVGLSTRRLIRSFGFTAECFGSAEEFLASGHVERTGCLILDVRMPGIDGLELQRRLAADGRPIPIVFLTGRASDEEERQALQAGAVAFLRKPVGREPLLRVVRSIFERTGSRGEDHDV